MQFAHTRLPLASQVDERPFRFRVSESSGTETFEFCHFCLLDLCCRCIPGSGAPDGGRKTEDDFFLFSQQQATGERRKMPKPVRKLCTTLYFSFLGFFFHDKHTHPFHQQSNLFIK